MRPFLLLLSGVLLFLPASALLAQSSPQQSSKLLAPVEEEPSLINQFDQILANNDPIDEQLEGFIKNYRYPNPTSTAYDTLLRNTRRFRSDEVPKYDAQTIANRLYGLPTLVSMDYNAYVQRYIDTYTLRKRDLSAKVLGLGRVYFPIFEAALDRAEMPIELKYLPVVESALNPHAVSPVGATGLWQFMLGTARMYNLGVNSFVDERKDPYKATNAALRYLQASYDEFGDWLLAIASYNCGPGNVRKAILRSGGKKTFWEIMRYLPRETRGYVPAFIAVTYLFNYASAHNIHPVYVEFDLNQDTLHLRKLDITLAEIAKMTGANLDELRYLNPALKLDRVPYSSQDYVLRVPPKVASYFAKYSRSISAEYGKHRSRPKPDAKAIAAQLKNKGVSYSPPKGTKLYYHTVKNGEVVGAIAERYGVSARSVARWNGLYRYKIKPGQKLKIYTTPSKAAVAAQQANRPAKASAPPPPISQASGKGTYYAVKNGDTLWDIAKRHGVSMEAIKQMNPGLDARDLKIGQAIRVN